MLKKILFIFALTAAALNMTGCNNYTAEETTVTAEETTVTAEETTVTAEETTVTAEETTVAAKETTVTAEETTVTTEETTVTAEEPVNEYGIPLSLYGEVSEGNVFVDYTYEPLGECTMTPVLEEAALKCYRESEYYMEFTDEETEKIKFYLDDVNEHMSMIEDKFYYDYIYESDYFANGKIQPVAGKAFAADDSHFVFVDTPYLAYGEQECIRTFLVYINPDGGAEIIDEMSFPQEPLLLDYGFEKQVIFGGSGLFGVESHNTLYRAGEEHADMLYTGRCWFEKNGFLVGAYGWQSSGGTMYYDTAAREYRYIIGKAVDIDTIKQMDTRGDLAEIIEYWEKKELMGAYIIGGKYYCFTYGFMDTGAIYTYENGRFTESENNAVRFTPEDKYMERKMVKEIDFEKAYAEMVTPEKATEIVK